MNVQLTSPGGSGGYAEGEMNLARIAAFSRKVQECVAYCKDIKDVFLHGEFHSMSEKQLQATLVKKCTPFVRQLISAEFTLNQLARPASIFDLFAHCHTQDPITIPLLEDLWCATSWHELAWSIVQAATVPAIVQAATLLPNFSKDQVIQLFDSKPALRRRFVSDCFIEVMKHTFPVPKMNAALRQELASVRCVIAGNPGILKHIQGNTTSIQSDTFKDSGCEQKIVLGKSCLPASDQPAEISLPNSKSIENKVERCPIELRGERESVYVLGTSKPLLTPVRYRIVKALCAAYPSRLSLRELKTQAKSEDANKVLGEIARLDADWRKTISFPRTYGDGYGLTADA